MTIGTRLAALVAGLSLGIVLVLGISLVKLHDELMADRQDQTRRLVETAVSLVGVYQGLAATGAMSADAAREEALERLAALRYDGRQYFWVNAMDGIMLRHPTRPQLDGTSVLDLQDANGERIFADMIDLVRAEGGGIYQYYWTTPENPDPRLKISYVEGVPEWGWVIGSGIYVDDVEEAFRDQALVLGGIGAVVLLLAIFLGTLIARGISRPLGRITAETRKLAAGDLDVEIPYTSKGDEVGGLARALEVFKDNARKVEDLHRAQEAEAARADRLRKHGLADVLHGFVEAGVASSESVVRLVRMKQELANANAQTQSMASAVEELVASIQEISETTRHASGDSQKAEQASHAGVASSTQAVGSMEQIVRAVRRSADEVNVLAEESSQIGTIVGEIESIAAQTNLLALNATIEAARAGEAGRGFAVVAGEVKSLANQTAKATEDIRGRIGQLRSRMDGIVAAMTSGVETVEAGRGVITDLGDQLQEIAGHVGNVTGKMAEVAGILDQQSAAANGVSEGTATIAQLASQNDAEVGHTLDAMDTMNQAIGAHIGSFADLGLDRIVVEISKTDHVAFKKRIVDAIAGRARMTSADVPDHKSCRFGKWYTAVTNPVIRNSREYAAIDAPHRRVHELAKSALDRFHRNDVAGAMAEIDGLDEASREVLGLLDCLAERLKARESEAAGKEEAA
jgi:methyl-accepting chemotaxis protein